MASSGDGAATSSPVLFAPHYLTKPIDPTKFPTTPVEPRAAQMSIKGLRNLDATPRLNLASFVTTQMEPECKAGNWLSQLLTPPREANRYDAWLQATN